MGSVSPKAWMSPTKNPVSRFFAKSLPKGLRRKVGLEEKRSYEQRRGRRARHQAMIDRRERSSLLDEV